MASVLPLGHHLDFSLKRVTMINELKIVIISTGSDLIKMLIGLTITHQLHILKPKGHAFSRHAKSGKWCKCHTRKLLDSA